MKLITMNIQGWNNPSSVTFKNRLDTMIEEIRSEQADIICIQEMIAGKDRKFIHQLETSLKEYEVILPSFDVDQHFKSVITVTCILKTLSNKINKVNLQENIELSNRYNYIELDGIRLLNVHLPQTTSFKNKAKYYILERLRLSKQSWKIIKKECTQYKKSLIIVGDFNERYTGTNLQDLTNEMNYTRVGQYDGIDHVLLSPAAHKQYPHTTSKLIKTALSDHPIIITEINKQI